MIQTFDLEKSHDGDRQEALNLREHLTSSNDANSAIGIKHKDAGVTWEDLEASGISGEESKVRHFVGHPPRFLAYGLCLSDLHLCVCR